MCSAIKWWINGFRFSLRNESKSQMKFSVICLLQHILVILPAEPEGSSRVRVRRSCQVVVVEEILYPPRDNYSFIVF